MAATATAPRARQKPSTTIEKHEARLAELDQADQEDAKRLTEIAAELEGIRTGSGAEAAPLLAERRQIAERQEDRRTERELVQAALHRAEGIEGAAKLEGEIAEMVPRVQASGKAVQDAVEALRGTLPLLIAMEKEYHAIRQRRTRLVQSHGDAPELASFEQITGVNRTLRAVLAQLVQ